MSSLFQAGTISPTPLPSFSQRQEVMLADFGEQLCDVMRQILVSLEVSRLFCPATFAEGTLHSLLAAGKSSVEAAVNRMVALFDQTDDLAFKAYGFDEVATATIRSTGRGQFLSSLRSSVGDTFLTCSDVLAFIVGAAFGRWDIRYATGEQAAPELPDPFAPLPVCPPGQLQNAQGLPARPGEVPAAYPVRIPWDGILVDDPNHPLDIERRVREVIEIIWNSKDGGPTAEAIEHEACEILGVKSLRDYFRKPAGFFADHLKRYSKSRRKASDFVSHLTWMPAK
jgi:hypothetical protein